MRLNEPIESPGVFWHPATPDTKVSGTLNISEEGRISLEVFGINTPPFDNPADTLVPAPEPFSSGKRIERILGVIKQKAVTLEDCIYGPYNFNFGGTISESTIHASRAYSGVLYEDTDSVTFNSVTFWLEGLHEWLMLSGYSVEEQFTSDKLRFTVTSAPVEPIVVDLGDQSSLQFDLSRTIPGVGPTATAITLNQLAHVAIHTDSPQPLDYFLSAIFPIEMLLALAMDRPSAITRVMAFTPELVRKVDGEERRLPIEVYGRFTPASSSSEDVSWHRLLFTYRDIADRVAEAITNWIRYCETASPAIRLHHSIASGGYRYAEGEFLSTVQAIEAIHRRTFEQGNYMPDSEFERMLADVDNVLPAGHRERVLQRLQHANEPSFRRRLKDLFKDFGNHFGEKGDRDRLVDEIVRSRNYLTHHDPGSAAEAPDPRALITMQNQLEALFQMHMLQALGFKLSEIDDIVRKRLGHKLNVTFL